MKTIVGAISALALSLSIAASEIRADPGTPAEQYAALFKEYGPVSGGMREATTDLERKAAVESLGTYPSKFLDLAEKYPEDPIALKALRQAVQAMSSTDSGAQIAWETNRSNFPGGSNDGSAARTVALLMRDHVLSAEIGPVCDRLRYSYRLESEEFLRAVLETNPHREMQGLACLFLARFLNDRLRMVQLAEDRPDLARRFEIVFGKDYLPKLQRLKQDGLAGTIEALFERAAEDYGDVKTSTGGTAGEQAKSELYDIRHLAIGMAARDIEGRDQDGIEFKLSDYRGKVVLLYFWLEF